MRTTQRPFIQSIALLSLLGLSALSPAVQGQSGPASPSTSASSAAPLLSPAPPADPIDRLRLENALRKLDKDIRQLGGTAGAAIVPIETGEVIASLNPHTAFNPASNAKLITSAAALRVLGPQYRYLTGLYGKTSGDTVKELVLRGEGDPSLTMAHILEMARELKAAGIRNVQSIGVDQSFFDNQYTPPAFEQQPNEWAPFRAPVAATSLNQNTILFTVRPTEKGKAAVLSADPPGFADMTGTVRTTSKGDPEKVTLSLTPSASRLSAGFGGSIPEKSRPLKIAKRIDDPRLFAGYALRSALKDIGIEIEGDVHLTQKREKNLLASHRSARLAELIHALGKDSDNFYAEMIFKTMGRTAPDTEATFQQAAARVTDMLRDLKVYDTNTLVKNGSGLFDANRITPSGLASLLRTVSKDSRIGPEFISHLAIGGVDGTLRNRFKAYANQRSIRAKTGTLDAVAALSGYILSPKGTPVIAFAVMVNGVPGKAASARKHIDELIASIAEDIWPN